MYCSETIIQLKALYYRVVRCKIQVLKNIVIKYIVSKNILLELCVKNCNELHKTNE